MTTSSDIPPTREDRIRLRLAEIISQCQSAQHELIELCQFNQSAWSEYGSELCSESMIHSESVLQETIDRLQLQILILHQHLEGLVDQSMVLQQGRDSITRIDQQIEVLIEHKKSHQAVVDLFNGIADLFE